MHRTPIGGESSVKVTVTSGEGLLRFARAEVHSGSAVYSILAIGNRRSLLQRART